MNLGPCMLLMDPMTFPNTCPFAVISFVNKFDPFFWTISLVDELCIINLKTWLAYSWFLKLTNAKRIKSLYRFFYCKLTCYFIIVWRYKAEPELKLQDSLKTNLNSVLCFTCFISSQSQSRPRFANLSWRNTILRK